ncbi:hypothetical protein ACFE04_017857 [Oxalis oulophora]
MNFEAYRKCQIFSSCAIMRFKNGSKVEVLNSNEFPSGAWQRGVIVSSNGHSYTVRFDSLLAESDVQKVLRKAIRPLPPPVSIVSGWTEGDVVEVLDDSSWKIATILKAMSGNFYLIRLLGSSKQFQVHKVNIRVRQCWQDERWILIGKGSGSSEVTKSYRVPLDDRLAVQKNSCFQESYNVSPRSLKRPSPSESSYAESWTGNAQKTRAFTQEGENVCVISRYPSIKKKKVSSSQMNGYYETVTHKRNCVAECPHVDFDNDASSIGSCTVINNSRSKFPRLVGPSNNAGRLYCSDAESYDLRGDDEEEYPYFIGESLASRVHSLELHAYNCTLGAFYASGPLSWEQESLLTNLRLSLHISNDEHLTELRKLISGKRQHL